MIFEVGKTYQHSTGKRMTIIGRLHTKTYGECLIGEDDIGVLQPVGEKEENAVNWREYTVESEKKHMKENRLSKTISDIAYILDSLVLLRNIQQMGDCNICKNRDCGYTPKAGRMVRYNCPFYKAESEE